MKEEFKKKWVKALKSGKFKQGKDSLYMLDTKTGEHQFCCLGVLEHIVNPVPWKRVNFNDDFWNVEDKIVFGVPTENDHNTLPVEWSYDEESGCSITMLSRETAEKVGLDDETGMELQKAVASMNDNEENFKEIAAYIEETF